MEHLWGGYRDEQGKYIYFSELCYLKGQPLETFFGQWQLLNFDILDHRGDKGRGKTEGVYLPSKQERTPQLGS